MGRYGTGMRDCCDSISREGAPHIVGCPNRIGAKIMTDRKTFTIPDGHEAVLDADGRATGETQPMTVRDGTVSDERLHEMKTWVGYGNAIDGPETFAVLTELLRTRQATACAVCGEHKSTPLRREDMGGYVCLTCIDAELSRRSVPSEPVAVKALEWHGPNVNGDIYARSILCVYTIRANMGSLGHWLTEVGRYFPTIEAAKAAAQANFDQRIRSALYPSPASKPEVTPAMVEVKPLEWSLDALTGRYWANTAIGRYHAWDVIGHAYFSLNDGSPVRAGMDDRTAKAAAQADFKSRILSALEVAP